MVMVNINAKINPEADIIKACKITKSCQAKKKPIGTNIKEASGMEMPSEREGRNGHLTGKFSLAA